MFSLYQTLMVRKLLTSENIEVAKGCLLVNTHSVFMLYLTSARANIDRVAVCVSLHYSLSRTLCTTDYVLLQTA